MRSLSEPMKERIMLVMKDFNRPVTVKEIADKMGESPAKVHYHVKKLEEYKVLVLDHTESVKGITAKYYAFTSDSISFKLDDKDDKNASQILSQLSKQSSFYFDEAKADFLSALLPQNQPSDNNDQLDLCISRSTTYCIEPAKVEELNDRLKAVLNEFRSDSPDAQKYKIFYSIVQQKHI